MEAFRFASPDHDDPLDLEAFEADLHGSIVLPGSPDYDVARQVHSAINDRRPALIVRAADAHDVAKTVVLARESGLTLSVRGGGHSLAGYGTNDGGIVLDLGAMKGLHIDPDRRVAWAQPGLTAGEYTNAVAAHGLATPFGDTGSVGISGLTLGGGIGWLVRKYGLAIDALEAVEIVTADGREITASEESHPDLFWAVRGGGGNFGVVTRFQFKLYPVGRDPRRRAVHAGDQGGPAQPRADRGQRPGGAEHDLIPDDSSAGSLRPGRAGRHALPDHHVRVVRRRPGRGPGGPPAVPRCRDAARRHGDADAVPGHLRSDCRSREAGPRRPSFALSEHDRRRRDRRDAYRDGRPKLTDDHGPAAGPRRRDVTGSGRCHSVLPSRRGGHGGHPHWFRGASTAATHLAWTEALHEALAANDAGVYSNFLEIEGEERIRSAYPGGTYERLSEVKRRYDPSNLFRMNQNIRPAARG